MNIIKNIQFFFFRKIKKKKKSFKHRITLANERKKNRGFLEIASLHLEFNKIGDFLGISDCL